MPRNIETYSLLLKLQLLIIVKVFQIFRTWLSHLFFLFFVRIEQQRLTIPLVILINRRIVEKLFQMFDHPFTRWEQIIQRTAEYQSLDNASIDNAEIHTSQKLHEVSKLALSIANFNNIMSGDVTYTLDRIKRINNAVIIDGEEAVRIINIRLSNFNLPLKTVSDIGLHFIRMINFGSECRRHKMHRIIRFEPAALICYECITNSM